MLFFEERELALELLSKLLLLLGHLLVADNFVHNRSDRGFRIDVSGIGHSLDLGTFVSRADSGLDRRGGKVRSLRTHYQKETLTFAG